MTNFFSEALFACLILGIYFMLQTFRKGGFKYKENRLFAIFCFSSVIWSLGFYGVIIQTKPDSAYIYRAIGMIGTFGYLISAQFIISYFSNINKTIRYTAEVFSFTGIIIYFFIIQKNQVTYSLSEIGMTYSFTSSFWNNAYITYSVIMALSMLAMVIYMIKKSPIQRIRDLGKKLLATEIVLIFGMLLDTIFPMFGKTAIPGSTIGQFIGLAVMYHTMTFVSKSRITISNMSEFVYFSITVPVLVFDSNMKLQILNDTGYSFLGIDKSSKLDTYSIDDLFELKEANIYKFSGKAKDADAICKHNELYCNLSINKILDSYNDHMGYIIIVTDLSERMKSMEKLEAAMKDAEYANQAKSTFLANMSHEIRTPMNAIIGFSELTLKMNIDEQVRKNVEDIKWASNNLLAIINDILDISKIESGKMELVLDDYYTASLLSDVSLIMAPQAAKKGLEFHMNVADNIPRTLYGDKVRLRGILINILNNAVKYTQKGSVTLDVSIASHTIDTVTIEFKITDTGIGIPKENIQHLFDIFERVDTKHHYRVEGSGLGLAIANGYVALMDGAIEVDSTPDVGSTFKITIVQKVINATPIDKESINQHTISENKNKTMHIEGIRVLVVDDNLVNLRVAHGLLTCYNLSVDTASSGEEAINMCKQTEYDMVFLDQMMPDMDGIETMKHIRDISAHYNHNGKCKIIVLTADAIKGSRERLLESGFDEYLGKPINLPRLDQLFINFIPADKITYSDTFENNNDSFDANTSDTADTSSIESSTDTTTYLTNQLAQVNVAMGMANCGGNQQNYLQILKITYEHGYKQLNELEQLLNAKDYTTYTIKVHALKSTSLNIGASSLSDMAKLHEEHGKNGDYEYIENNFDSLKTNYIELLKDIEAVLIHYELISNDKDEQKVIDESMIQPLLSYVERCLNSFNFGKIFDILAEIKTYTFPEKYDEMFNKMELLMDDLAVDELKELVEEWRED